MNNVVQCAFVILALSVLGCESDRPINPVENAGVDTTEEGEGTVKVTLLLNWTPEAEHGGFYAAVLNGH